MIDVRHQLTHVHRKDFICLEIIILYVRVVELHFCTCFVAGLCTATAALWSSTAACNSSTLQCSHQQSAQPILTFRTCLWPVSTATWPLSSCTVTTSVYSVYCCLDCPHRVQNRPDTYRTNNCGKYLSITV